MKPKALIRFRTTKLSSAPPRSLYIHVSAIMATVSSMPPRYRVSTKPRGSTASSRRRACDTVNRPEGSGRHGLLMESSKTELDRRWLAKSKIKTLIQVHRITTGSRSRMAWGSGEGLVVKTGPERALKMPKAVSGMTMDLRSFRVVNHTVRMW